MVDVVIVMVIPITERYYRHLNIPSGDLRISITSACNMRCVYCHNEGQMLENCFMEKSMIFSIVSQSLKYGVHKVRLTGGEPLLHPDIVDICIGLKKMPGVNNLGLNTNGLEKKKLFDLASLKLLDQVVVGIDYFDGVVSKNSPIGKSSKEVLDTVLELKKMGVNVQLTTVFTNNKEDVYKMVEWCLKQGILLKVLERCTPLSECNDYSSVDYDMLIEELLEKFDLRKGITADLNEFYGYNEKKGKVLFFQSHCNRKQCDTCSRLHMRITSNYMAKPCLQRSDTEFPLFPDFDDSMKRAIVNLGNGPDNPVL